MPERRFLRKSEHAVDWAALTERLVALDKGKGRIGRPPCNPGVTLRMLEVAYLCSLSQPVTKGYVNYGLSAKSFLGLAADEPAPHHSALTAFRRRIIKPGGERCPQELLEEIIQQAAGVEFRIADVADRTNTAANVNVSGDEHLREKRRKPPRDGAAARWGAKGTRMAQDKKAKIVEQTERFYTTRRI